MRFYVIEGVNGSGKTSIVKALKPWMDSLDDATRGTTQFLKEPDSLGYQLLKDETSNDYRRMVAMFTNRVEHHRLMALSVGTDRFILDRYHPSTFVYQCCLGDVSESLFWDMVKGLDFPHPDMYFHVEVPAEVAIDRLASRGGNVKPPEYYARISTAYDKFFRDFKYEIDNSNDTQVVSIDGEQPVLNSALKIFNKIWENEHKSQ